MIGPKWITQAQAIQLIRSIGAHATRTGYGSELRVSAKGGSYFTEDALDAWHTAKCMVGAN